MIKSIHAREHHFGWDNSIQPKVIVSPGTSIEIQALDSSAMQLNINSTVVDLIALDFAKVNPVTGPIFIEGAEPGDAIKVTFEEFKPSGWGWTANIPGFGLLADQFAEPAIHIWKYDANNPTTSDFHSGGSVPLKPFVGTIGLALAEMLCFIADTYILNIILAGLAGYIAMGIHTVLNVYRFQRIGFYILTVLYLIRALLLYCVSTV